MSFEVELSIKKPLHMHRDGDRWLLIMQLTSNLALEIIKPSLLDVSLSNHQTTTPLGVGMSRVVYIG